MSSQGNQAKGQPALKGHAPLRANNACTKGKKTPNKTKIKKHHPGTPHYLISSPPNTKKKKDAVYGLEVFDPFSLRQAEKL